MFVFKYIVYNKVNFPTFKVSLLSLYTTKLMNLIEEFGLLFEKVSTALNIVCTTVLVGYFKNPVPSAGKDKDVLLSPEAFSKQFFTILSNS